MKKVLYPLPTLQTLQDLELECKDFEETWGDLAIIIIGGLGI